LSFSINTNIASLQAQGYLENSSNFQAQTINRVTSGLRIVQSGDDAAGLAIANGFRSDEAVLTQGIRNANDGLSTLQTIDGGMNNISQLLDRARTLATQSASGTFTGDRSVLNNEFQSVMTEINRQAQSIGLDQGGQFAKSLSVFIGGGKTNNGIDAVTNGSVSVDLSQATVDSKSLGLQGYTAGYQYDPKITSGVGSSDSNMYDLGASAKTSVANIISDNSAAGTTIHYALSGVGFTNVDVAVNLSGVNDTTSLATAINAGIDAAATTNAALKSANVTAVIHTGTDGAQQLQFTSSTSAFSVAAGTFDASTGAFTVDKTANAFMGNFSTGTNGGNDATSGVGAAAANDAYMVAKGTQQYSSDWTDLATDDTSPDTQTISFTALDASGTPHATQVTLAASKTADLTAAGAAAAINTALQATNNPALQGIVVSASEDGKSITFSSASNSKFTVSFGATTGATGGDGFTTDANTIQTSAVVGESATADIGTQSSAEAAVTALANAVSKLGTAQAAVGKGENNFNYAVNLAQSQNTNLAAAESRIRDADLASEAANLSKAQILVQAGTAALAQANSAPQAILTLLRS